MDLIIEETAAVEAEEGPGDQKDHREEGSDRGEELGGLTSKHPFD